MSEEYVNPDSITGRYEAWASKRIKELEQQLAQAQQESEQLKASRAAIAAEAVEKMAATLEQLAEARALLDDVVTLMMLTRTTDVLRAGASTSLYQEIRAFLQKLSG